MVQIGEEKRLIPFHDEKGSLDSPVLTHSECVILIDWYSGNGKRPGCYYRV